MNHDEDIMDWHVERLLMQPSPPKLTCEMCKEHSIYVDLFNTRYRKPNMEDIDTMAQLCYGCYMHYIKIPTDQEWSDYYSSIL